MFDGVGVWVGVKVGVSVKVGVILGVGVSIGQGVAVGSGVSVGPMVLVGKRVIVGSAQNTSLPNLSRLFHCISAMIFIKMIAATPAMINLFLTTITFQSMC